MRLAFLLLVFLIPQVLNLMKMAKIFGKVENPPTPKSSATLSMKSCTDSCYYDPDCFLVEFYSGNTCSFYNFSTVQASIKVVNTEPESEMYVAFKTILPEDTCPVTFEAINLTYIHPNGTAFPWKTLPDGFIFPICKSGWTRFDRSNGNAVCMKMVPKPRVTKTVAKAGCEQLEALLIGVETLGEANWMWDQLSTISNETVFWLDGVRNESCQPLTSEDKTPRCNIFDWSDSMTTGSSVFSSGDKSLELNYFTNGVQENCLVVNIDNYQNKRRLNDVSCTDYRSSGMICGYKLY